MSTLQRTLLKTTEGKRQRDTVPQWPYYYPERAIINSVGLIVQDIAAHTISIVPLSILVAIQK